MTGRFPKIVHTAGGLILAMAATASAATANDPRSSEEKALDAQAAQRYEAASKFFQTFIESSVGDPRVPKAQKAMYDCIVALAKEWSADREGEAARLYLWLADDPHTIPEAREDYLKKAPQILTNAMTEAKTRRAFARALQLQKDWLAIFPDKPSPYAPEDLETFAFEGVLSACQDRWNLMVLPDVLAQFYPTSPAPLDNFIKRNRNEPLPVSYLRSLVDLGWSGRMLAESQVLPADSPVRSHSTYAGLVEKAAMARVDAWGAQGNVAAAMDAIALARTVLPENKLGLLKTLEAKFAKKVVGDPQELNFTGPVRGKVNWQDSGAGFTTKEVVIDEGADITIMPGFLINQGHLELRRGARLHLKGTAAQPIVFRDIILSQHDGARLDAEHTVFINCTFEKTGERSSNRYSTRWEFSNCILYRSNFESLSLSDYGLSMTNSAWVESQLPQRVVLSMDVAGVYKDRWNGVENCLFFRCSMAPSTLWMTDQCNFVRCAITRDNQFDSRNPLTVALYVPDGDPMPAKLRTNTTVSDRGDLRCNYVRKPFEVAVPATLWALLPIDGYELPRRKPPTTTTAPATAPATTPAK